MKVKLKKIKVDNPAVYIINQYRITAANHINGALNTMRANAGNHPAMMATANQLYEDLIHLQMIGLLSKRDYDEAAAIAFETMAGAVVGFSLPKIIIVRNEDEEDICSMSEAKELVRTAIAAPINKCLKALLDDSDEDWHEDGWESREEYNQCLIKTVHNVMRVSRIIGATTTNDHDNVTEHMKQCIETQTFAALELE